MATRFATEMRGVGDENEPEVSTGGIAFCTDGERNLRGGGGGGGGADGAASAEEESRGGGGGGGGSEEADVQ